MKNPNSLKSAIYVTGLSLFLLGGCEEPYEEAPPTMANTPGSDDDRSTYSGSNLGDGRTSTLGKARGSAQDLVNQVEQDSRNLANKIDQENKGNR